MFPSKFRSALLAFIAIFLLGACQTAPRSGFTPAQTAMMQSQGFVETGSGWELSFADRLLFDVDSADVRTEMNDRIAQMARGLLSVGITVLRVEGFTDSTGSTEYNSNLSLGRATTVAQLMHAHGFLPANVATRGWGEANPIADNETADGRAQNRRVVIIVSAQ